MGQSQSTRRRTPSYRIDASMGRSKTEGTDSFQDTTIQVEPSLHGTAREGFSVPTEEKQYEKVHESEYNKGEEIPVDRNIPTVTVTGNKLRTE